MWWLVGIAALWLLIVLVTAAVRVLSFRRTFRRQVPFANAMSDRAVVKMALDHMIGR